MVSLVKIIMNFIEKNSHFRRCKSWRSPGGCKEWRRENNFVLLSKDFEDPVRNEETCSNFCTKIYSDSSL